MEQVGVGRGGVAFVLARVPRVVLGAGSLELRCPLREIRTKEYRKSLLGPPIFQNNARERRERPEAPGRRRPPASTPRDASPAPDRPTLRSSALSPRRRVSTVPTTTTRTPPQRLQSLPQPAPSDLRPHPAGRRQHRARRRPSRPRPRPPRSPAPRPPPEWRAPCGPSRLPPLHRPPCPSRHRPPAPPCPPPGPAPPLLGPRRPAPGPPPRGARAPRPPHVTRPPPPPRPPTRFPWLPTRRTPPPTPRPPPPPGGALEATGAGPSSTSSPSMRTSLLGIAPWRRPALTRWRACADARRDPGIPARWPRPLGRLPQAPADSPLPHLPPPPQPPRPSWSGSTEGRRVDSPITGGKRPSGGGRAGVRGKRGGTERARGRRWQGRGSGPCGKRTGC